MSSSFVHFSKPDEDIYRMALDVSQVKLEEVMYVGNGEFFVKVVADMGINGIAHKDLSSTRKQMDQAGLEI